MFSGGSYDEVARWLRNFTASHAKRENPRAEVALEHGDERDGVSYGVRVMLGASSSDLVEYDYKDVATNRGSLAWCGERAERTRALVRALAAGQGVAGTARA